MESNGKDEAEEKRQTGIRRVKRQTGMRRVNDATCWRKMPWTRRVKRQR